MNTYKKVIVAALVGAVGCAHAEMVSQEAEVVAEVVQEQPVAETSLPVIDDCQENQELEKYLQELSQEFEESSKAKAK